ncbi:MAG: dihydrodipicolinate synthase family protein [Pirellulaceae bacterium]|jgi:4-hydroxy-tetrahydrodipicolinate synthase|nr:dihydrodipicolinate synthase family protein [Pirellulaceae bacterium]
MSNNLQLRGVIPPFATPLSDGELDLLGVDRLVEHILEGGVDGLFLLGTTGEGPSLTVRQRYHLIERVCETNRQRVPVLCAISDPSLGEAIELAEHAHGAGAHAVVSAGPYYLPISQQQLAAYCFELADRSPLPVVLYNMPSCTKLTFDMATVEQLADHPNIVGVKDSSGDMDYFYELVDRFGDAEFSLLIGPEENLARAMLCGGDGGVCGGGNLFPQLYVRIVAAARDGDRQRLNALQSLVEEVFATIYFVGDHHPTRILQGVKAALFGLGVCSAEMAPPIAPLADEQLERVAAAARAMRSRVEAAVV